jgi:outer membrane murein-binding lipoprotein Lpp
VREQKASNRPPKEPPADAETDLRAQVATLREKVDALSAENQALRERLAALGESAS